MSKDQQTNQTPHPTLLLFTPHNVLLNLYHPLKKAVPVGTLYKYSLDIISTILLNALLGTVLLLSLVHHYSTTLFETKPDHRDTRSSRTRIARVTSRIFHDSKKFPFKRSSRTTSESDSGTQRQNEALERALVPSLAYYYSLLGIEIETHRVRTADNYVLDLWHFVPAENVELSTTRGGGRPILMIHGLLQSSGSFASSGKQSLAYYLYTQGYDIWLGNNRIGFTPDETKVDTDEYWDWDITEMARYDLPALVDFVLANNVANWEKLTLIGHSQGTTQIFLSLLGDCNGMLSKVDNYVALAPATYPGVLLKESTVLKLLAMGIDSEFLFGKRSFLQIMMLVRNLMVGRRIFSFVCYVMFNYLFDWNDALWGGSNLRNRHFLFSPVYVSVKLLRWWIGAERGLKDGYERFFPESVAWFDELNPGNKEANPNIMLFVPKQDRLVDGEKLINHFVNCETNVNYKIWYIDEYAHVDVLWATDVIDRIGKPMVENFIH